MEDTNEKFMRRHMTGVDITAGIIITLAVMTAIFYGVKYSQLRQEYDALNQQTTRIVMNKKALAFMQMFTNDVLGAKSEVSFETRLQLENAVRELDDEEILASWKRFTASPTENKAQEEVKILLSLLAKKVQ